MVTFSCGNIDPLWHFRHVGIFSLISGFHSMKMSVSCMLCGRCLACTSVCKSVLKCLNCSIALHSCDFGSVAEGQFEQIWGVLSFKSVKGTDVIYMYIPARSCRYVVQEGLHIPISKDTESIHYLPWNREWEVIQWQALMAWKSMESTPALFLFSPLLFINFRAN